mmetsp:Transcript_21233/g.63609  ORF Transcript_21233/g.63609 Transcript_21233/m.63609 type:complete len:258 (-) Transcript_21233:1420-2193(-)|eukprot:365939-Chlamydomonas_euryale.AAC.4
MLRPGTDKRHASLLLCSDLPTPHADGPRLRHPPAAAASAANLMQGALRNLRTHRARGNSRFDTLCSSRIFAIPRREPHQSRWLPPPTCACDLDLPASSCSQPLCRFQACGRSEAAGSGRKWRRAAPSDCGSGTWGWRSPGHDTHAPGFESTLTGRQIARLASRQCRTHAHADGIRVLQSNSASHGGARRSSYYPAAVRAAAWTCSRPHLQWPVARASRQQCGPGWRAVRTYADTQLAIPLQQEVFMGPHASRAIGVH